MLPAALVVVCCVVVVPVTGSVVVVVVFVDFRPGAAPSRIYISPRGREVAGRYGFVEWEGPPLEQTELYKKKSGAEIVEQLFNFTDKGEREVALRPELTPTLARVVAAH